MEDWRMMEDWHIISPQLGGGGGHFQVQLVRGVVLHPTWVTNHFNTCLPLLTHLEVSLHTWSFAPFSLKCDCEPI